MALDRFMTPRKRTATGAPVPREGPAPAKPARPKTLLITSCSATKLDHPAPAKQLYCGDIFKKSLQLAQQNGWDVRIVSAKHGMVTPDTVLEPYDLKMQGMAVRSAIQPQVMAEAQKLFPLYDKVVLIMGAEYRKLFDPLTKRRQGPEAYKKMTHPKIEMIIGGQGELKHKLLEMTRSKRKE
jgi:hypothetical protein